MRRYTRRQHKKLINECIRNLFLPPYFYLHKTDTQRYKNRSGEYGKALQKKITTKNSLSITYKMPQNKIKRVYTVNVPNMGQNEVLKVIASYFESN